MEIALARTVLTVAAGRVAFALGLAGIGVLLLAMETASASTTFAVDRTDDSAAASACTSAPNDCSLRGAINSANTTAGADTINFASGITTLTLTTITTAPHNPDNNNATGDLDITDDLTIDGGSSRVTIQGTAGWNERIIDIMGAAPGNSTDVTISDTTVRNGKAIPSTNPRSSLGGGIRVNGDARATNGASLTLQRSTVTNNSAEGSGGGIHDEFQSTITLVNSTVSNNTSGIDPAGDGRNGPSGGIHSSGTLSLTNSTVTGNEAADSGGGIGVLGTGTATITNSTVSGNTAASSGGNTNGGGIYVSSSGTVALTRSTVSNNTADSSADGDGWGEGGGLYADGATLTLKNTTVSGNTAESGSQLDADGRGGGIYTSSTVELANATIANNRAGDDGIGGRGGGVFGVSGSSITLRNTIVAANSADLAANFAATPISQGHNLLGENPGTGLQSTDIVSSTPRLGPLDNNGGPTRTHALLPDSLAIDSGNPAAPGSGGNACLSTDQRGVARPKDGDGKGTTICDIGAYERNDLTSPTVTATIPTGGKTGVARGTNLTGTFSEKMTRATLTESTFKLFKVNSNGSLRQVTNVAVSSTTEGLKATLNPDSQLLANTRYRAVITTGAKDRAGNRLDQNPTAAGNQQKVWTFTTGGS